MKIAIATDAWYPQINGVVRSLAKTAEALTSLGHTVRLFTPEGFKTIPCPGYASIRLALRPYKRLAALLEEFAPHTIHIATEGPMGLAARRYCVNRDVPFTTSYHTQFPEYVRLRAPVPLGVSYSYLRWFHGAAVRTFVPTASQRERLAARGFGHLEIWPRGVDVNLFRPGDKSFLDAPRPIFMYVGRTAVEKNINAFLEMDLPGSYYVIGDGPELPALRKKYPRVIFTGFKHGQELAHHLAAADVFVFPSRTDTFGLVLLEAMACGVPVAAYPVTGPRDVVIHGETGILDDDLARAAQAALRLDGQRCREYALQCSWERASQRFLELLHVNTPPPHAAPAAVSPFD
ncbi:MAG: glycosyltransferase family 4 protein [Pseudomonadota bacterium]